MSQISAEDVDRLFEGRASSDTGELAPLARFLSEFREALETVPAPDVRAAHRAAMAGAFHPPAPAQPERKLRRRRRFMPRLAVATAGLVVATGVAMAATGTLPDPVQDAVAKAARWVGIDLPRGSDHREQPGSAKKKKEISLPQHDRSGGGTGVAPDVVPIDPDVVRAKAEEKIEETKRQVDVFVGDVMDKSVELKDKLRKTVELQRRKQSAEKRSRARAAAQRWRDRPS